MNTDEQTPLHPGDERLDLEAEIQRRHERDFKLSIAVCLIVCGMLIGLIWMNAIL